MKHPDKKVLGQFLDGHFHDGQLPKEISRRQFVEGQFLERAFLLTDIFSDRQFLEWHFPKRKILWGTFTRIILYVLREYKDDWYELSTK